MVTDFEGKTSAIGEYNLLSVSVCTESNRVRSLGQSLSQKSYIHSRTALPSEREHIIDNLPVCYRKAIDIIL